MLSGDLAVLQAPIFDGLSFDPFALLDDGLCPAEVGIGRRNVVQALVVALMVVMFDERLTLDQPIQCPLRVGWKKRIFCLSCSSRINWNELRAGWCDGR